MTDLPAKIEAAAGVAQQAVDAADAMATALLPFKVTDSAGAQWAVDAAKQIREQRRELEAERDSVAKPLRKLASDHSKRWKPAIDTLDRVERHLKNEALLFQVEERERQAAALKAATSQEEVADAVAVLAPKPDGLQERESWSWEVTDISQIPREYWVLDKFRIDREAREQKGALNVPGIRAVRRTTAVLR